MLRQALVLLSCVAVLSLSNAAMSDTFGPGGNQFTIDFVTISGDTNPASGYGVVNNDFRMGVYEITNDQWDKFKAELGVPVTGAPSEAYFTDTSWIGADIPTTEVSWYEAAQFVNWLNTSTSHHAAYKFTGTQGTGDYTFAVWSAAEADGGTNLYRHKDALYFLPAEDEWVKAAYWNGTSLQTYATKSGDTLHQGDGTSGSGWNYYEGDHVFDPPSPWPVGSGSEELNGTFDMMGNVGEWMESPWTSGDYGTGTASHRGLRGGSYYYIEGDQRASDTRDAVNPHFGGYTFGFRVASEVPEAATMALLSIGGLGLLRRRRT